MEKYTEWSSMQTKAYHDASLSLQAFEQMAAALRVYAGWMYFKKVGQREYLFHALDRHNNGKSMGARSPDTEAKLADWLAQKAEAEINYGTASKSLEEHRAVCQALKLGRFPKTAAKLLRHLALSGVDQHFTVIGTHALYAYEALAGVHFHSDLTATKDFDILWDARSRITFMTNNHTDEGGLFAVLKRVDKTFRRNSERSFQAINASGFAVEVLCPDEPVMPPLHALRDGITPLHLKGLDMLLTLPLLHEIVIAEDGYPLRLQVPDPVAFTLHKCWVAEQSDRRADKAKRDRLQAIVVADLVKKRMPALGFDVDRIQNLAPALMDYLEVVTGDSDFGRN
jgi:hypothetical protein